MHSTKHEELESYSRLENYTHEANTHKMFNYNVSKKLVYYLSTNPHRIIFCNRIWGEKY